MCLIHTCVQCTRYLGVCVAHIIVYVAHGFVYIKHMENNLTVAIICLLLVFAPICFGLFSKEGE
jgi:hypothetical protein